jgi:hypothetical protein
VGVCAAAIAATSTTRAIVIIKMRFMSSLLDQQRHAAAD